MLLISQSGVMGDDAPPVGTTEGELAPMTSEQITAFADQDAGWVTEKVGVYEPTMDLATNTDSELGNFLQRPLRESAQTWLVGQPFFYKFNPWSAFCENTYIRDKIKNYQLLRMKLNVKIVISGTKFHYGRALVSYNPYTKGDQVTVDRNFITQDLIQASQKPHFFLNPTTNSGGELSLPFFWTKNYLSIPAADWNDMGEIVISSFGNLLHANGGDDPVTVTTYIWAEDVVLTIPTQSDPPLVSQSGRRSAKDEKNNIAAKDEYGSGIISKPASAIAKAAGALTNLPVIGPYMTATQIGSNAVSKVAQIFGYSRPNVITDIAQYKPTPTGNLANIDAADAAMKLTLDSKAEVTVDSRTVGLDGSDEMGILDYVKRESYLTQFAWSPSDAVDDLLWNTRVLPMQLDNVNGEIHMTPLAHMATAFEQWQGSLKFRFQIVKSDFHKGRILVRWDPNQFTSSVDYNTNYSRVIDIAETDDFEIVVGWGQAAPWKQCGQPYSTGSNFSDSSRLLANSDQGNGVLELAVLNELVSPNIDAPISINVYVSACDDFKLAGPTNGKFNNFHLFFSGPLNAQSRIEYLDDDEEPLESQSSKPNTETGDSTDSDKPTASGEMMQIAKKGDQTDATYLVYYGDPPCSIRELCKRYTFTRFWNPSQAAEDTLRLNSVRNKNMPYYTGYDPKGIDLATDGTTPLTVGPTPYVSWFTPAYAGYRGAMRRKFFFSAFNTTQSPYVVREGYSGSGNGVFNFTFYSLTQTRQNIQKYLSSRFGNSTGAGIAATNLSINNTIEAELPYYYPQRFSASRTIQAQDLDCNSHTVRTTDVLIDTTGPQPERLGTVFQEHAAVGEDFSLFFFTGVPIYYEYSLTEAS
ncbi:hypothetical protein 2 [Beihai picorna-like virus 33]|uniref:hypothetical protein 2 n=1 Tax=Beihai picorna-like virus 33 TaxID=1922576 RepID=UPI00090947C2|nr:hypothetical protein 2 [Beihai picorna-like virus 33]APG78973.1 hypothetical protein 2 [Beihai picorna-like virus 33]